MALFKSLRHASSARGVIATRNDQDVVCQPVEAGFPPIQSYQGNIFRLDLRGPETVEGLERHYEGGFLSSAAYADPLSADQASAIADRLRIEIDLIIGRYAADHKLYRIKSL